jgi:hypothetical protein
MSLFRKCSLVGDNLAWYAGNRFNPPTINKNDPLAVYTIVWQGGIVLETSDYALAEKTFNEYDEIAHSSSDKAKGSLNLGKQKISNIGVLTDIGRGSDV